MYTYRGAKQVPPLRADGACVWSAERRARLSGESKTESKTKNERSWLVRVANAT